MLFLPGSGDVKSILKGDFSFGRCLYSYKEFVEVYGDLLSSKDQSLISFMPRLSDNLNHEPTNPDCMKHCTIFFSHNRSN